MNIDSNEYKTICEGCNKLWFMLADGKDSNAIIETAYRIIGNPIVITTNTVLFKSIGIKSNELLNKMFLVGYDETSSGEEPIHIMPRKLALQNHQTNYGLVIAGIYDNYGIYLGRVMISGEKPFNPDVTKYYAKVLAKIMANIFSAEVFQQLNTFIPDFSLFHSLITGGNFENNRIKTKLSDMNFLPETGMNVIVIDQRDQPLLTALLNMRKYADMFSAKIYSMYHGNIVIINCKSLSDTLSISGYIEKVLKKDKFRCGVSREFFLLSDVSMMYKQSIFALNMGEFYDVKEPVIEYETYSAEHSICLMASYVNPITLLDPRLIKLKEYDDAGPHHLIDTLRVHFKNIKSPTEGAKELFIHRNTYFRRLAKIEEITGWDINSGECIAKVNFYFKIIDLLEQADEKNLFDISYIAKEE